jgi:O-antigen/teichoic acid export membrane protein
MAVPARRIPTALPWRQVKRMGYRVSWALGDQVMSSLTNFLLSAYIARSLGAEQFGAFSLAYVTYGFANNASRGLSIEPLLIRFSGAEARRWRKATGGCTGTALLVGLATGTLALTVGTLMGGTTGLAFLALGLMLPGLLLQDSWRFCFFAVRRGRDAFLNDLTWAAVQVPVLLALKATGHANVFWFIVAWGTGAYAGAILGMIQARVMPRLVGATFWLILHRDLGPRYLVENAGSNAADSVRQYSVSSILGLTAIGDMNAANVLMGPFRILSFGLGMITIPEAAQILRNTPRRLPLFCLAVSVVLSLTALGWGALLLVALPLGLGHLMLGATWRPAYPLVLPTVLTIAASCAAGGSAIGMHALGAARRSLRASIMTAAIILPLAISGAFLGGVLGTLYFGALAAWLATIMSWWYLRAAIRESRTVPVPIWLWPHSGGKHHKAMPKSRSTPTSVDVKTPPPREQPGQRSAGHR